ncbi:MAG: NADH-quinone oxidoreductase subunit D [Desulfobacterales bacterium]|nr:MAG: NADH-quinone oxidoreductase subunit D [Desulfobacterales bacterium]UCG07898.1 MAG: NADH-quinone oxidoreductase subunit D [Desulfobacterales bacterium]
MPLTTEEMILNMGPHHPSTHGVLRFILRTDGEVIYSCLPDVGFLHRGLEKIAEKVSYAQFMPYTDRIDYLAAMNCNLGYAITVERLAGIEVPLRAEYIRVMVAELNRIISHLISVGTFALDIGAVTPFTHALRERERVNDLFEELCGARLTYNYVRFGGVAFDLPAGFLEGVNRFLDYFLPRLTQFNRLISKNKIFKERLSGVGVISAADALGYALAGPNLRASGVDWDLRRDEPYSIYADLDFEVPVGSAEFGQIGDCYNRYWLRIREMEQSVRILRQCVAAMPDGAFWNRSKKKLKLPPGEIYVRTEAPRGELGFYLISRGDDRPYRLKIRTGSFTAMSIVEKISPGLMVADLVALIASLDVIAPEIDR